MGESRASRHEPTGLRRLSVLEASRELKITTEALRKRLQRGTVPYEKDNRGRVWVLLDADRVRYERTRLISELRAQRDRLREQLDAKDQADAETRRLLLQAIERLPLAAEDPEPPESPGPSHHKPLPTRARARRQPPRARGGASRSEQMVDPESLRKMAEIQQRKARLLRGEPIRELHERTEAELIEKHDALVEEARLVSDVDAKMRYLDRAQRYADELARRDTVRQGERMEALTRSLNILTWAIAIATFIGVGLTAWAVLSGG